VNTYVDYSPAELTELNEQLQGQTARQIIAWVYEHFDPQTVYMSTSFGAEGMVLLDLLCQKYKYPEVFTIDTGRNFQQTYDVWHRAQQKYGISIKGYYPDAQRLHKLTSEHGPSLMYESVDLRKQCCHIRKVEPLKKALKGARVWLTSLRRGQSASRADTPAISYNAQYDLIKLCPLIRWSGEDVWEYIRQNDVPYNALHDQGFPTVGCEPCTRAISPGEPLRAGRWWWEDQDDKECGIHIENGKIVRSKKPNFSI